MGWKRSMPAVVGPAGNCSQVASRLFVGDATSATDLSLLWKLGVTLVVNCADDLAQTGYAQLAQDYDAEGWREMGQLLDNEWWRHLWRRPGNATRLRRLAYPLPDSPTRCEVCTLVHGGLWVLDEIIRALQSERTEGSVLVHCVSGRNRSTTLVCAVLMRLHRCTFSAALAWVQRVRPIAQPCEEYEQALIELQRAIEMESPGGVASLEPLTSIVCSDGRELVTIPLPVAAMDSSHTRSHTPVLVPARQEAHVCGDALATSEGAGTPESRLVPPKASPGHGEGGGRNKGDVRKGASAGCTAVTSESSAAVAPPQRLEKRFAPGRSRTQASPSPGSPTRIPCCDVRVLLTQRSHVREL